MSNFIVYTFSVPGELLPFYVGKGRPTRPQQHFLPHNLQRKTHFYNKLNNLLEKGIYPEIKIVASGLLEKQAFNLEINLIRICGRQDNGTGCLCNHTNGGEGNSDLDRIGRPHSIDDRIKMSKPKSLKGKQSLKIARQSMAVPIESFNLETKKVIKCYPSENSVKADGYSQSSVNAVLKGRRKYAHNLGWKYTA
jgi:hypothetical protein